MIDMYTVEQHNGVINRYVDKIDKVFSYKIKQADIYVNIHKFMVVDDDVVEFTKNSIYFTNIVIDTICDGILSVGLDKVNIVSLSDYIADMIYGNTNHRFIDYDKLHSETFGMFMDMVIKYIIKDLETMLEDIVVIDDRLTLLLDKEYFMSKYIATSKINNNTITIVRFKDWL